ncbi:MAG TPA: hypothetical protein VHX87_13510 [Galbitalea sp.]|jgi:hypothetical protein|nr:hypothetical protein [Galbitalea sp.]
MATISAPNRSIIGWLFIAGGALQILAALVSLANAGNVGAIYAISNIAIGMAFVLMTVWLAFALISRVAYLIAAIGWLLLALTSLINLGIVGTLAVFIAIIGSVFAGVIVFTGHVFARQTDILFLVAMIVGAINLLLSQNGNVPGVLETVIVIAFGALLLVSGIWMLRRR